MLQLGDSLPHTSARCRRIGAARHPESLCRAWPAPHHSLCPCPCVWLLRQVGSVSSISFHNIHVAAAENGIFVAGAAGAPVTGLSISRLQLHMARRSSWPGGAQDYRPGVRGLVRSGTTAPVWVEQAQRVLLEDVEVGWDCLAPGVAQRGILDQVCTPVGACEISLARESWWFMQGLLPPHAPNRKKHRLGGASCVQAVQAAGVLTQPLLLHLAPPRQLGTPPAGLQVIYHAPFRQDWELALRVDARSAGGLTLRRFSIRVAEEARGLRMGDPEEAGASAAAAAAVR